MPAASLDLGIGIDKGDAEPRRQPAPDGGFARPHHADEHDQPLAEGSDDVGLGRWTCAG